MLKLLQSELLDAYQKENAKRIQDEFNLNPVLSGGLVFKTYTFTQAETGLKVPHGLNFTPVDVIITSITGAGTFTVNYGQIDGVNLNVTTSAACVVRLLLGRLGA